MLDYQNDVLDEIDWGENGIVPVVVQENDGEVLTLAYMNKDSLLKTLEEGIAHYYSRSKDRIRMKGETSGNIQKVEEIRVDCDEDALLMSVDQSGAACHKGERSCFYRELGEPDKSSDGIDYSLNILKELEEIIKDRKESEKENSYTSDLFDEGESEIGKKFGEEAIEVLMAEDRDNLVHEAADLLYHLLVLLSLYDVELKDVMDELGERRR